MTWKERRLITVLSVILAILSAALLIVLGIRYRQSRDAVQDPAAQAVQAAQAAGSTYASLSVYSGSATLSFSIQEDGTWVWDDDTEFHLDDSTIESMMDLLSDLTPQQVLSDPESLESYELDAPSASISAVKVDQSTVSVTFGKATTDGTSRYAMMNDDASTIYIFADTLYQALQTPIYDMMTLPELPELEQDGSYGEVAMEKVDWKLRNKDYVKQILQCRPETVYVEGDIFAAYPVVHLLRKKHVPVLAMAERGGERILVRIPSGS